MSTIDVSPTLFQMFASTLIVIIILSLVFMAVYLTFNWIAFIGAIGIMSLVYISNPSFAENILANTSVQYYCILFGITLLFALDACKRDANIVILVIVGIISTLLSFYAQTTTMIKISLWIDTYIVLTILMTFWNDCGPSTDIFKMFKTNKPDIDNEILEK
jgi:hypothetical protein